MVDFKAKKTITKKIEKWIVQEVNNHRGFIFYTKNKGYCTCCKSTIDTYGRNHYERGICPKCGKDVYFIANRYRSKKQDFYYDIMVPEKYGKNFAFRLYHVWSYYSHNKESCRPNLYFDEYARAFFDESGAHYSSNEMKNCGAICKLWDYETGKYGMWRDFKSRTYHFKDSYFCFSENLLSKLKGTRFEKYMFLSDFIKKEQQSALTPNGYILSGRKTVALFELLPKYPSIEYLYKLGFSTLIDNFAQHSRSNEFRSLNLKGKNPKAVLGTELSYLRKFDLSKLSELHIKFLKLCQSVGYKISVETFRELQGSPDSIISVMKIHNTYSIPINRLLNYIAKQRAKEERISKYSLIKFIDYKDYLSECEQLDYDLENEQVLYPKDLREAHARTSTAIEYKQNEDKIEKFKKVFNKFYKLNFQSKEYSVRLASDMSEIIREGKILGHCVGGYASRMADGQCLIFFVRDNEDIGSPFYTLELDPKTLQVVQCRGERNRGMTEEVSNFVKKWKSEVLQKKKKISKQKVAI